MRKLIPAFFAIIILVSCTSTPATSTVIPATDTPQPTPIPAGMNCTAINAAATPEAALSAEFESNAHTSGPADAPVTIVVFSNYQCLECAFLGVSLSQIRQAHPDDVRIVYLHAPRDGNDKDIPAIQAAEAADLQGKFWEMHDLLFAKQAEWSALETGAFEAWAVGQAETLGMDAARFRSDYAGEEVAARVQAAVEFAASVPSLTLPTFFVNSNSPYTGLADFASLDNVVRLYILNAHQFSECPPWEIDPLKQYIATLETAKGDIVIELYADKAPQAVNSFVFLARRGWFDGMTFYRVVPGALAQTGDPSGTGMGMPGYLFETELPAGLTFDEAGVVAMENNGPDTNGSRFFITLAPLTQLNGSYTIFGHVLSNMDVLTQLTARDPQPGMYLAPGDEILHVTIEER